ncbi:uncharacterized protein LOC116125215 [Pistacia vera]|uniref:uncharacterized protein LOC116125215 n=1 Tax=Pistacia vera TaxID=55513 RepID=UPI001262FAC9|nr:uncharacterized protein LOC116125215 [Pistacia vera]
MALLSENKLKFVDGSIKAPPSTASLFSVWERCNTMVLSWLTHSLSLSITSSILWIDKAYDVWDDLQECFLQGDIFRISYLQEEIYGFKQGDRSVTNYFTELKILWDELKNLRPLPACTCATPCSCGVLTTFKKYQNSDYVIRFLKGLTDQFAIVRTQIMLMDPLPPINKVFSLVLQQERQLNFGVAKVFVNKAVKENSAANKSQNNRRFNPANSQHNGDNRFCTFCGKPRHTVETCYKKHGFPPGYKSKSHNPTTHNVTVEENGTDLPMQSDATVNSQEDTGATDHIAHSLFSFDSYKQIKPILVTLPNGSKITAQYSGVVSLTEKLVLTNDLTLWKTIGSAKVDDGLYVMTKSSVSAASSVHLSVSLASNHSVPLPQNSTVFDSDPCPPKYTSLSTSSSLPPDNFSSTDSPIPSPVIPPDRNSKRLRKPPSYLKDYHCNMVTAPELSVPQSGTTYPLSSVLSYSNLSPNQLHFTLAVSTIF